jgi:IS30 family transposase
VVAKKLAEDWSPEQISGWLKRRYPDDEAMRVSHETIYLTLFVQTRGALKRELLAAHLRSRRTMRRGRHASTAGQRRGQSKKPSRSENVRRRPRIERCPDTGKGISSQDRAIPTLLPWSSAARAS